MRLLKLVPDNTNISFVRLRAWAFGLTALLTAIGYPELTSVARSIAAVTFRDFEMITVLAVVYLTIVWTFSILIRMLEARLALPKEA